MVDIKEIIRNIRLIAFDFDGVFTDNMVHVFEDGSEAVRCYRGDGIGLQKLQQFGIDVVIISTETNPVVSARAQKLKIRCHQACTDKRATLESVAQESGISLTEVAFVGNDTNDLAMYPLLIDLFASLSKPYNRYPATVCSSPYQSLPYSPCNSSSLYRGKGNGKLSYIST